MPDIETVRKLCDILEINKDEILGGSIAETKQSRKWLKVCIAISVMISVISFFLALFFALDGTGYIERHTQSGVVYVSVFSEGKLLTAEEYQINSDIFFKDFKNGYKADVGYGKICGTVNTPDEQSVEFGLINVNNWHNIHIRLDINAESGKLFARQTVSYETDDKTYQVDVNEEAATGNSVSVYREGV